MKQDSKIKFTQKHHDEIVKLLDYSDPSEDLELIQNKLKNNIENGEAPRYLYIIRQEQTNLYKIGISNKVETRIKNLKTGNPNELKLIVCFEADLSDFLGREISYLEKFLHNCYANNKVKGEWFRLDYSDIADLCHFLVSRDLGFIGDYNINELAEYNRRIQSDEY